MLVTIPLGEKTRASVKSHKLHCAPLPWHFASFCNTLI